MSTFGLFLFWIALIWFMVAQVRKQRAMGGDLSSKNNKRNAFGLKDDFPNLAYLLSLLIPQRDRDHIVGDLKEEYVKIVLPEHGYHRASLWYWKELIRSIFPYMRGSARHSLRSVAALTFRKPQLITGLIAAIIFTQATITQMEQNLATNGEIGVPNHRIGDSIDHPRKHKTIPSRKSKDYSNGFGSEDFGENGLGASNLAPFRRGYPPLASFSKLEVDLGTALEKPRPGQASLEISPEHATPSIASESGITGGGVGGGSCVDRNGMSVAVGYMSADSDIPCGSPGSILLQS